MMDQLEERLTYATSLFEGNSIKRLISRLVDCYESMVQNDSISKIYLVLDSEKKLFNEWNSTEVDFPKNKTLYGLFEEQVEKTPKNIALVFENEELTYSELNKRANYLANQIIGKLKPDTLVGLYVRSKFRNGNFNV